MTSVEKILEFIDEPNESLHESKIISPVDWPQFGEIEFRDVSLRNETDSTHLLRNISFKINGGEKIGIVGRSGAGKSTLLRTLFRLDRNKHDGNILIDGIDIKDLSLFDLRDNLAIIPVYISI